MAWGENDNSSNIHNNDDEQLKWIEYTEVKQNTSIEVQNYRNNKNFFAFSFFISQFQWTLCVRV